MYIHDERIVLSLLIRLYYLMSSKSVTEAPQCAILSAQTRVNVVKNYSTISNINVQPFKAFCIRDHLSLSSLVCMPPPPSGPHAHCMSPNYSYTPFNVAAAYTRPFGDRTWHQPTGLSPGGPLHWSTLPAWPPGLESPQVQHTAA